MSLIRVTYGCINSLVHAIFWNNKAIECGLLIILQFTWGDLPFLVICFLFCDHGILKRNLLIDIFLKKSWEGIVNIIKDSFGCFISINIWLFLLRDPVRWLCKLYWEPPNTATSNFPDWLFHTEAGLSLLRTPH